MVSALNQIQILSEQHIPFFATVICQMNSLHISFLQSNNEVMMFQETDIPASQKYFAIEGISRFMAKTGPLNFLPGIPRGPTSYTELSNTSGFPRV